MLNISKNTIKDSSPFLGAKSLEITLPKKESKKRLKILIWVIVAFFRCKQTLSNYKVLSKLSDTFLQFLVPNNPYLLPFFMT